jgi:hypothetical protein
MVTSNNNPLDQFSNYTVKYVLVAFAYTEDACLTDIDGSLGEPGTIFSGGGCGKPAAVIINDFASKIFSIDRYETDFSFYGSLSPSTTQMLGAIRIFDRYGGYFPTFLNDITQKLGGVSETHIAFSLRVFFIGTDSDDPSINDKIVATKPLIFNMVSMVQSLADFSAHFYTLFLAAAYNTTAQFPGFSKLYQTTITNQDGNPSTEVPKPDVPGSTIMKRGEEDAQKTAPRQKRIDKSKTMQTIQDVFEGMAADLMQQKYVHQRQLQEWLAYVRDDYVKKIATPVQRKSPGYLPVDYRLLFDPTYAGYQIDNRNMPFEQPEQSQLSKGIRVINLPEGENLPVMFDRLMKLSSQVAKDYLNQKTYKTVFILIRRCNGKYDLFMKLKQIKMPLNSQSKDSGPGDNPAPLEFNFQQPGVENDTDVMTLQGKLNSQIFLNMLEQQVDDPNAKVVFGNREQATAERNANLDFFKTFFSGVRMNVNNHNNSMEFGDHSGTIDNMLSPNINAQTNMFTLTIRGNSDVMSDINRNPLAVFNDAADGAVHYKTPEYSPMYVKAIIALTPINDPDNPDNVSEIYYYQNYYHLYKIKTLIEGNDFNQELGLLRTDDIS